MADEFTVCVDQLMANQMRAMEEMESVRRNAGEGTSMVRELKECRICQDEDEESNLEAPCGCIGTLKFAHRECVQKWCMRKGDTTCEICHQEYTPNYTAPLPRANSGGLIISIRRAWWAGDSDTEDQVEYEDRRHVGRRTDPRVNTCCSSVALTLMVLLFLRHVLMILTDTGLLKNGASMDVSLVQFFCFFLPSYAMARAIYIVHVRKRQEAEAAAALQRAASTE